MNKAPRISSFRVQRFLLLFLGFFLYIQRAKSSSALSRIVAYYPDGDGIDASGNERHGTKHNVISATDRFGISAGCSSFNSVNSY
ncbi:MAG: hypothetical protein ACO1N3_00565, partial [Gammaproteobacteria bacterium]